MKSEVEKAFVIYLERLKTQQPDTSFENPDTKLELYEIFKESWLKMTDEQREEFYSPTHFAAGKCEPIFKEQIARIKELARSASRETPANLDPKGEIGKTKCPLHLIPPQAMEETAWAHAEGARDYGPWNWRQKQVCASTYIAAIMRHTNAWRSGEDKCPKSGRSHLAHIAANCFILMDAMLFGKLVDDRAK